MFDENKWIWQHQNYPNFKFDRSKIAPIICTVSRNIGKLEGILASIQKSGIDFLEVDASTQEIIKSSQIEGEILNRESVRSSILKKLHKRENFKDYSTKHTDGLVEMFLDSANHKPLTHERLYGWHNTLFPSGYSGLYKIDVAKYRSEDMSVVSQKDGREKVHYNAVPPKKLLKEMNAFINYVNTSTDDPYIKASIAHFWFVTIHPFDDGNGRIARTITNYVLAKELSTKHQYFSISTAIANDKKNYYNILENTQKLLKNKNLEIDTWIEWHTTMINNAIDMSLTQVQIILDKTSFWDKAREHSLNERQIKVLNKILNIGENYFEGGLTTKKYVSMTKISLATAKRDISDMLEKKLIIQIVGAIGRNTKYKINI